MRWPFGARSAALTIARVAWPNDTQVDQWSLRMLSDTTIRERTIAEARERFEAAIAEVEATASGDWFPCAQHAPIADRMCDYCTTTTQNMIRATTNPADLAASK